MIFDVLSKYILLLNQWAYDGTKTRKVFLCVRVVRNGERPRAYSRHFQVVHRLLVTLRDAKSTCVPAMGGIESNILKTTDEPFVVVIDATAVEHH